MSAKQIPPFDFPSANNRLYALAEGLTVHDVIGAQFPHKSGVVVLRTVKDTGFGFACW